jgi:phage terminase large subunit-like protein
VAPKTTTRSPRSTPRRTSSRRDATAARTLRPFTVDHFRAWTALQVLDNGDYWDLKDFQAEIVEDLFDDQTYELWMVIPEGNAKTTLLAGIGLYHCQYTLDAEVPIGASSRDQAKIMHSQAAGFVKRSTSMSKRFRVYDGYRKIVCRETRGFTQVFAADSDTGDGVIPTLVLIDELHRHRNLNLYRTWRGKLSKRDASLACISTAGEPDSEYEQIRQRMRTEADDITTDGAHVRAARGGLVLHDFAVPADGDCEDLEQVKQANPLPAMTIEKLAAKRDSPVMTHGHWMRFVCNRPHRGRNSAIDEREWDSWGTDELPPEGDPVSVGIDLGWIWDDTALVPLWTKDPAKWLFGKPEILTPPRDGTSLSVEKIKAALLKIHDRNPVELVVLDPNAGGEQFAQWIEDELKIPVIAHGQSDKPMCLAASRFLEQLRTGRLHHPRDPSFTRHVLNAIEKLLNDGRMKFERPSKSRSPDLQDRRVVDALDAATMVVSVKVAELLEDEWDYSDYRIELL